MAQEDHFGSHRGYMGAQRGLMRAQRGHMEPQKGNTGSQRGHMRAQIGHLGAQRDQLKPKYHLGPPLWLYNGQLGFLYGQGVPQWTQQGSQTVHHEPKGDGCWPQAGQGRL